MQNDTHAGWDQFWSTPAQLDAYSGAGQSHPLLDAAWMAFFAQVKLQATAQPGALKALDLASGRGVVVDYLGRQFPDGSVAITCLDASASSIASIKQRFGAVTGLVADARKTGLDSAGYDIVTSQFGIEYAGPKAFIEAMRLVKPGGHLGLVIHCRDGQIHHKCDQALQAVRAVLNSQVMENAAKAFSLGFAYAARGQNLAGYQKALNELQKSVTLVEKVLHRYGDDIAGSAIVRLRDDIVAMVRGLPSYEREETLRWTAKMHAELRAYVTRMHAMCQAAAGDDMITYIGASLRERQFEDIRIEHIAGDAAGLPIGWWVQARRAG